MCECVQDACWLSAQQKAQMLDMRTQWLQHMDAITAFHKQAVQDLHKSQPTDVVSHQDHSLHVRVTLSFVWGCGCLCVCTCVCGCVCIAMIADSRQLCTS